VPFDSWDVVEATEFTEELLNGLFDNEIAAVRIPNFISPEACRIGSAAVLSNGFDYYETLDPPLGRIGIAQYDHRGDKDEYFRLAALAHEKRKELFAEAGDPIPRVADAVSRAWDGKVGLANEDAYGDYFAGIVRVTVKGIKVHCDWAEHDAPGWQVANVTGQLAWNIYMDLTETGGETTVYKRPSDGDIEQYAEGAFGFYNAKAIESAEGRTVTPRKGELVIFSSRNAHAVAPTGGAGSRISSASFIGRLPDGSIILWS
jgi:2OG-Fe(II) oxygenase superfamily